MSKLKGKLEEIIGQYEAGYWYGLGIDGAVSAILAAVSEHMEEVPRPDITMMIKNWTGDWDNSQPCALCLTGAVVQAQRELYRESLKGDE